TGTYTVTVTLAGGCSGSSSQAVTINPNPSPTIAGTFAACQGASASLNATPGLTTYSWSNGATTSGINPNVAGTYTVTVTNTNGCTGTTSQLVTINPNPAPAIAGTFTVCQGTSATLNVTAGLTSYQWSNGATSATINPNATGTYTVTVTNSNGCTGTTSQAVLVNNNPTPAITGTFAVCSGNSASLNAPAGMTNYVWSNGATTSAINPSTAGTFTVTVTDANGCVGSTSQSVTINSNPVPTISGTFVACQGNAAALNTTAGLSTYSWSNGASTASINPSVSGTYTVTVTNASGCTGTTSQLVTINPNPAPAIVGTFTVCQGASATLNATAGLTSYQWSNGATSATINPNATGTYTVTVTNSNGCTGTTSQAVLVNNNPTPAITGTFAVCSGSSATLNAPAGMTNYVWSNGATTSAINPITAGTFSVTVTDANGCVGSTSQLVTINSNPVPTISGTFVACQGNTTTLNASPGLASYTWSNGATTSSINPTVAGTYTVTVTSASGCSGATSQLVTINANPTPAIAGTFAVCQGASASLNATPGLTSYQWSNGATSASINPNATGTYTVTVTNSNGCTGTTSQAVIVNNNPTPVITGTFAVCSGSSATLNAPAGMTNYVWSNGATTSAINPSAAGTFTVTVTDVNGCVGSTSQLVTINSNPVPTISGTFVACQGNTTTLNAPAGFTYSWNNGASSGTINPGAAGLYTVTVTDANGCTGIASQLVTINSNPTPSISGTFAACQGFSASLNATPGLVSYQWSDGTSAAAINPSLGGTYTVTVTDVNGCIGTASQLVTINANPVPVISGNNAICDGTTTSFNAGGYASYVWSDGSTSASISPGTAGVYTVTVTDANGCIGSTSQSLTVYTLPTATIVGDNTICYGDNSDLNVSFTGTAPFTYVWTNGITNSSPVISSTNSSLVNVSPGSTNVYTLVSVSDANCPGTLNGAATITVNPLPIPVISGDLAICDGETSVLNATPGYVSYTWSNSSNSASITTGTGGPYTVTVTDLNGCNGTSASANLVVNMVPEVSFIADTLITCKEQKGVFTNTSIYDSGSSFAWTFGDGGTSSASNPSHLYPSQGTYPVSLTITTPAGCVSSNTGSIDIVFFPLPVADFVTSPNINGVFNGKVEFVDRSDFAVSWRWDFGDGFYALTQNTEHYFNEVGDFNVRLTVTNLAGCEDTHSETISIIPYFVPNAFTPNGDGINDNFFFSGYDLDVASYEMKIFDRWGSLMFAGQDQLDIWKGNGPDGGDAPQGTYAYRIIVKTRGGKEHVFNGAVNLIR
ncbi:MAG: PKD domain-containing protein, partial [Bacteroidota bacterium]